MTRHEHPDREDREEVELLMPSRPSLELISPNSFGTHFPDALVEMGVPHGAIFLNKRAFCAHALLKP